MVLLESELQEFIQNKDDIRLMVKGFLQEGDINTNITNRDTLAIMEFVSRTLPGVRRR